MVLNNDDDDDDIVQGCPGGLLQFSKGKTVNIFLASISSGIRTNVAEQGQTPCLDNSQKVWLLSCPYHIITPRMVVPLDYEMIYHVQNYDNITNCQCLVAVQTKIQIIIIT